MKVKEDLKTIFWNVGSSLTDKKIELLSEAIVSFNPDIFCIAEGSSSRENCRKLISLFEAKGYLTFYSPLWVENQVIQGNTKDEAGEGVDSYVARRMGLKIFVKNDQTTKSPFVSTDQKLNGRIVLLRVYFNFQQITFVFLHNKSKEGETEDTLKQTDFIKEIYGMLAVSKIIGPDERLIIMGDFNLNPWDRLLNSETYLYTSFFQTRNSILLRGEEKCFYNPIVETLSRSTVTNLAGTHYSRGKGWGLFDFALYNTKDFLLQFDIITEFENGSKLLNGSDDLHRDFFNYEIDHLPILTKVTKVISEYEKYE